jgi:serine/threonine-protein kinase
VPIDIAAFTVSRICRALDYAHNKRSPDGKPLGIVHRDVTPGNIMITSEGEVKLADFGVARARTEHLDAADDDRVGKIGYFSPEQIESEPVDHRTDLFSLSVILYELLTLQLPFPGETFEKSVQAVINTEPLDPREWNSNIPQDLVEICLKGLAKNPDKRYRNASEMLYAIEYYMYHDRYGPTTQALAAYLREVFPDLDTEPGSPTHAAATVRMDYQ